MVDKKLISYIKTQLNSGYSLQAIESNLLKNGYPQGLVKEAVSEIYNPRKGLSPKFFIIGLSVILAIAAVSSLSYFFITSNDASSTLSLDIGCSKSAVLSGEILSCVDSFEGSGKHDLVIKHEIINSDTNKIISLATGELSIDAPSESSSSLLIPGDISSGKYILRLVATSENGKKIATTNIFVEPDSKDDDKVEAEDIYEEVVPVTEELSDFTQEKEDEEQGSAEEDSIKDSSGVDLAEKAASSETSSETFDKFTSVEALDEVKKISVSNPNKASTLCPDFEFESTRDLCYAYIGREAADRSYCDKIVDERTKDSCYSDVAIALFRPEMCKDIEKDNRRDNCYMGFVTGEEKDFSVCESVVNPYLQESCTYLRELSDTDKQQLAFYQSLINESMQTLSFE